jgi:hypothetical protein
MRDYTPENSAPVPERVVDCPTCGLPAEISDQFMLGGVPGPVEHVKVVCVRRHWHTLPLDTLPVVSRLSLHA